MSPELDGWYALVALGHEHGIDLPGEVPPKAAPLVRRLLKVFAIVLGDGVALSEQVRTLRDEIQTFTAEASRMAEGVEAQGAAITSLEEDVRALVAERDKTVAELAVATATIRELRGEDVERLGIQREDRKNAWDRVMANDDAYADQARTAPSDAQTSQHTTTENQ